MSCRSSKTCSLAIGLATATTELPDAMAQSLFHALRHEAASLGPDSDAYVTAADVLREQLAEQLEQMGLRPQRRDGLRRRLAAAAGEDLPVDVRYALVYFQSRAAGEARQLQLRLSLVAGATGQSEEQVRARFEELRADAPPGRKPRIGPVERRWLRGLNADPATRHALHHLEVELPAGVTVGDGDAARVRCARCGQFAGATHHCPAVALHETARWSTRPAAGLPLVDVAGDRARLRTSDPAGVAALLVDDPTIPIVVPVGALVDPTSTYPAIASEGEVRGEAGVAVDPAGDVIVVPRTLQCFTCHEVLPCRHVVETVDELRVQIQTARAAAAGDIGAAAAQLTRPRRPEPPPLPPDLSTFSYSTDLALFAEHVRAAQDAEDGGEDPIGYVTSGAVYGYGAQREFGVELEYDLDVWPGADSDVDPDYLGGQLLELGLTEQSWMGEYHSAQHRGYTTEESGWSLEEDSSAGGGELVSPILSDTETGWRNLATACRVIREHSGVPSERTGGHVHVAAPEYVADAGRVSRLVSLVNEYEDTIRQLSDAGRGRDWQENASPMSAPPALGYLTVGQAWNEQMRNRTVNLEAVAFPPDGHAQEAHAEFRCWDGSLAPSRIQAQIKVSLALTDYAARHPDEPAGQATPSPTGGLDLPTDPASPGFEETSRSIRSLIDRLFRRDADKQQIAALWALTNRPGS